MSGIGVMQIPVLESNYIHLLHDCESGMTLAVDPGVDEPVLDALEKSEWGLSHILLTHHHVDHTGGVPGLKKATRSRVVGARADAARLPLLDDDVADGDRLSVGAMDIHVLATPGHTTGHVCYYLPKQGILFSGDTLFLLGCGRLFEGTALDMWASLQRLRSLPDMTQVYCGHEYTSANLDFALSILPDDPSLLARASDIRAMREQGRSTVPGVMVEEKQTNPFLRADDPDVARALGLPEDSAPLTVFTELRRRKDIF